MRLFLSGDVMTGRGIDQVLSHPGHPKLHEPHVRDAREYVRLVETVHGPIEKPLSDAAIWGDVIEELARVQPDARIINLETSITTADTLWPQKHIHYRMNPKNVGCLTAAGIDCCCLANNHVLDWGEGGLLETLETLDRAGIRHTGAGRDLREAAAPAVMERAGGRHRVLVFAFASTTSGVPPEWQATDHRPGIALLPDLSPATADRVAEQVQEFRRNGDVVIASIHWGGNWGYEIPPQQQTFARRLIDAGVDLLHGHSSHHVKAMEVYRERLILYGCGDLLTDYEGIGGHHQFRGDLSLLYLPELNPDDGSLVRLSMVPMQMRGLRLKRPEPDDRQWLVDRLKAECEPFGVRVLPGRAGTLRVDGVHAERTPEHR